MSDTVHPSESQHWYTRAGEPCYEVPGADGVLRPTTLRDARKMKLVPSVTTIIKCASAPGLELWKQEQTLLAALTLPRKPDEKEVDWLARVRLDAKEQARKAAQRGQDIHAAIQRRFEGVNPSEEDWPYVRAAIDQVRILIGESDVHSHVVEHAFAHTAGFGGKLDLWTRCTEEFITDFKTKAFDQETAKKLAWDEHCIQLAAYRYGIGRPAARCCNVFVSTTVPGLAVAHEWSEPELERGLDMFRALLNYYQSKARYVSAF